MKIGPLYDLLKGKPDKGTFSMNDIQMKSFLEIKKMHQRCRETLLDKYLQTCVYGM
jgi:hypothetical protein